MTIRRRVAATSLASILALGSFGLAACADEDGDGADSDEEVDQLDEGAEDVGDEVEDEVREGADEIDDDE